MSMNITIGGLSEFLWEGDEQNVTITYPDGATPIDIVGTLADWCNVDIMDLYHLTITASENRGKRRSTGVMVEYEWDGVVYDDYVSISQSYYQGDEPSFSLNVSQMKFYCDGKPTMGDGSFSVWCKNVDEVGVVCDDWLSVSGELGAIDNEGFSKYSGKVICSANENKVNREGSIGLVDVYTSAASPTIKIIQAMKSEEGGEDEPEIPSEADTYIGAIWKDITYTFPTAEYADYSIWKDGEEVYRGRAYQNPSDGTIEVMINKICSNYMPDVYLTEGYDWIVGGYETFELRDGNGALLQTYKFINDWSYEKELRTGLLSHPIKSTFAIAKSQKLPFSIWGAGEPVSVPYGVEYWEDYVDEFGESIGSFDDTAIANDELVSVSFPSRQQAKPQYVKSAYIGDDFWPYVENCHIPWVIYYLNPYGGWDWFQIEKGNGCVDEKREITQYQYTQNYTNTDIKFGNNRYLSEIGYRWSVHTGRLSLEQGRRMWMLLESNRVYLHDTINDKIYPVIIENSEYDIYNRPHQTSVIQYTIEMSASQTRERK